MARRRLKLAWISNEATRRATLKKRRKGLLKKLKELSILCDVSACAILYSPNEPQPEAWPSAPEATGILSRFRAMPEMEQSKKMMNQESFLSQRVTKLHDQLRRQDRENRELESAALLRECMAGASVNNLRIEELAALAWLLNLKTKAVQDRIDHLRIAAALKGPLVLRDDKSSTYYNEAMRWFANVGDGDGATAREQNYQQMGQLSRVGGGSGGVVVGDDVLTAAASAAFGAENQGNWENLLPY
ncbi:hypothetical protein IEQ34_009600 [Dendrobium chrysotoxum]|uniref:MADS-box domain-containing protein n=1 Tax=Dendrobium chrysotoxum TaxID=161865 RepID=A0AAV7H163_DENCH|nr:hypothetical protein IEQ34_009600 [Dendrobium chrysotoxum]